MALVLVATLGWGCHLTRETAREDVVFEITHDLSGADPVRAVFVTGSLAELGGDDVAKAVQLVSSDAIHWRVTISLPVNRSYTYRFLEDRALPGLTFNPVAIGDEQSGSTEVDSLLPVTKTIYYHSSFASPVLHWRQDAGAFESLPMEAIDEGRQIGEIRWAGFQFGEARRPIEFFITDGVGAGRDPVGDGSYSTPLDAFFLQDEHLFAYLPAASVSPPRRDYEVRPDCLSSTQIESTILGETREYRVFLPRGYEEHAERRYPVLYLFDSTALWDDCLFPPGDNTGPMDEDGAIAAELVRLGQMGEVIQVGVDNLELEDCLWYEERARDYSPPGDTVTILAEQFGCSVVTGEGDRHLSFLSTELKPLIDANYRTRPDAAHTFLAGFSHGGTGAVYAGWQSPQIFGRVGSLSGFFRDSPNLLERIRTEPKREIRVYLDSNLLEGHNYEGTVALRDELASKAPQPYRVEGDLRHFLAPLVGHDHRVAGQRLPQMLPFLYPASEELGLPLASTDSAEQD